MDTIGQVIYITIGFAIGAAVMYFGPLIVEWIDERSNK